MWESWDKIIFFVYNLQVNAFLKDYYRSICLGTDTDTLHHTRTLAGNRPVPDQVNAGQNWQCKHLETDTRKRIYYMPTSFICPKMRINAISDETDVLVLLCHHCQKYNNKRQMSMQDYRRKASMAYTAIYRLIVTLSILYCVLMQ